MALPKWITLDVDAVLTRLSSPEVTAVTTLVLADGQDDPLPEIVQSVVASVRDAVAANPNNVLADGETIPFSAIRHALAIVRGLLVTRIPGLADALLDDVRKKEIETAEMWLRSKPLVVRPDEAAPDDEQLSHPTTEVISAPTRRASRDTLAGL